eukprot:jgi/Ulvmu1/11350/UM075_0010.1
MAENVNEEQFLLVVQDQGLQELLDHVLQAAEDPTTQMELQMHTARVGTLFINHEGNSGAFVVTLHDVPTQIETYKSHNHVHMIKNGDIGQALMLHSIGYGDGQNQEQALSTAMGTLIQMESAGALPSEISCGLTPPMVQPNKVFKAEPEVKPELVTEVEAQLLALMHGEAPEGWVIEDTAEVYIEDKEAGGGEWVPLSEAPAEYRMPPT